MSKEEYRIQLLNEISGKVYAEDFDTADKMCDYYRLIYGPMPGENSATTTNNK